MAPTCDRDDCDAELTDIKRVAAVDDERRAVGRFAGACANGHLSVWDEVEG
jgi:hypothetical protein